MRPTLILCFMLCAGFAMAGSANAQDTDAFEPAAQAHRPGRWSMQFQVAENFQLRAFEGAGLAMTRNSGTNSAWRFGVRLDGLFTEGDLTSTATTDSNSSQDVRPIDRQRYSARFDLLRLHRYHPAQRVGLELGVGPSVEFLRARDEVEASSELTSSRREFRDSASSYGIAGRLGVEVFLARALSVHAQYGTFAGYQQVTSTLLVRDTFPDGSIRDAAVDNQRRRWFLSSQGVTMGFSVYL